MRTRIIQAQGVAEILRRVGADALMRDMIQRLEEALLSFDPSKVSLPVRGGFAYERPNRGLIEWMPIMASGRHATLKVVGYHPHNPQAFRIPTILSTVGRYDLASGHLVGLADATFLTALRTGAASGVASKRLAHPDATILGLIGTGAQAVTQAHALGLCFPLSQILIHDTDTNALASFQQRVAHLVPAGCTITPAPTDKIAETSDILCTCTSVAPGEGPVFRTTAVKPWLHINGVGADFPGKFEVPKTLLERSQLIPDFRAQAIIEGECQQVHEADIGPELFKLMQQADEESKAASSRDRVTVFDSTGYALEDHVALDLLLTHAETLNVGDLVELESLAGDPLDPYDLGQPAAPAARAPKAEAV
ncbi:MAG: ornithine cyclodeaminase family protein [Pseudomonadota bacterium]